MTATLADYFELPAIEIKKEKQAHEAKPRYKARTYSPDTNIELWLYNNAPQSFQELIDIRYCLYHRCSRAGFTVARRDRDDFRITGRCGTLHIVSNKARRYLLWQLRILARENGWRGALPGTRTEPSLSSKLLGKYPETKYA
jgi:hypothetical protein